MKTWKSSGIRAAALILAVPSAVLAAPIATLPDLVSVTIYEQTNATVPTVYAPNAPQLLARLANPLSDQNRDFSFFTTENYDVFYSDADGTFNPNGAYLTIEGVWTQQPQFGSMNINEVELTFGGANPGSRFGDFVASFQYGSNCNAGNCIAGSEDLAVDHDLATFPRFGATDPNDPNERFRLTIGFEGISNPPPPPGELPEPASMLLIATALLGFGVSARRRT